MRGKVIFRRKNRRISRGCPPYFPVSLFGAFRRYRAPRHRRQGSFRNAESLSVGFARAVVELGSQLPVQGGLLAASLRGFFVFM
jgi:hypothetical protein